MIILFTGVQSLSVIDSLSHLSKYFYSNFNVLFPVFFLLQKDFYIDFVGIFETFFVFFIVIFCSIVLGTYQNLLCFPIVLCYYLVFWYFILLLFLIYCIYKYKLVWLSLYGYVYILIYFLYKKVNFYLNFYFTCILKFSLLH